MNEKERKKKCLKQEKGVPVRSVWSSKESSSVLEKGKKQKSVPECLLFVVLFTVCPFFFFRKKKVLFWV